MPDSRTPSTRTRRTNGHRSPRAAATRNGKQAKTVEAQHPAWELFASALLQLHAVQRRMTGLMPRDFAGLVIDDAEVDRLLTSLPGMDGPRADQLRQHTGRLEAQVEERRAELHAAAKKDHTDPLYCIARAAALTGPELETLALLASVEISLQKQRLVAYLQDNVSATRPTLATLDDFMPGAGSRTAAPGSGLVRAALIAVDDSGPWAARTVRLEERVVWAIKGDDSPDAGLPKDHRLVPAPQRNGAEQHMMTVITGADRQSRLLKAREVTAVEKFLVVPEPPDDDMWQAVVREATVTGAGVIVEAESELRHETAYWLDRAAHLAFAISTKEEQPLERMPQRAWREFRVSDGEAAEADWKSELGQSPEQTYRLDREQLRLVARAHAALEGDMGAAVRRLASGHLDRLALQVHPSRTWDDLVLPEREVRQLRELAQRYRHGSTVYGGWGFKPFPSSGTVALFAGVSGTGKTLAAEVIAADLGLDVYKIDLSSVVSKYIGETEKNLERIFDAASAGNMVLFFDEADALFGKRSDVSDAHDRYANIEVAYLLQRLETYDGLVVLATNLQGNIDQAFLRRIHVSIDFPMPTGPERLRIWRLSLPSQAPQDEIDFEFLATQFRVSGGNIRNAALTAAFFAASEDSAITMRQVVQGLQRELEKLGRLITPEEFGNYHGLLIGQG